MNQIEAQRLAASTNQLRPEWPLASLSAFIHKNLIARAYRDAAVALTWVACDPDSLTPARVLENGPWWKATQAQEPTLAAVTHMCPTHPSEKAWNCGPCADEAVPPTDAYRAARAAIPHRTPIHTHPEPPATDLTGARARAEQEADHG